MANPSPTPAYWTKQRLAIGAVVLIVGGLLIANNVNKRVQHVSRSPMGTHCEETSDCMSGICLRYENRRICTDECAPDGKCAGATKCADVEVTQGNFKKLKKYCVPR